MSEAELRQRKEHADRVDIHVNQLAEHYDSVQIFVTRMEGEKDQTRSIQRGAGNWFARYGQVREWVTVEEEEMRQRVRPL